MLALSQPSVAFTHTYSSFEAEQEDFAGEVWQEDVAVEAWQEDFAVEAGKGKRSTPSQLTKFK